MSKNQKTIPSASDTEIRKDSHVELALSSQNHQIDSRFYYEPMLAAHPGKKDKWRAKIGDRILKYPLWVSSMTGGTPKTDELNIRLAKAVGKFGLGMGSGSARIALDNPDKLDSFKLRPYLGPNAPYYLNFGIAQLESMVLSDSMVKVERLMAQVDADGIIVHVNPLQEWMQPEGDQIKFSPIKTLERILHVFTYPVIVKEVGQGFGYESMKALMQLPFTAIEFAANGGTNFSKVELLRSKTKSKYLMPFVQVGQSAEEMVDLSNRLLEELGDLAMCKNFIISGGIKNFLDGYYLLQRSKGSAIYAQASEFLRHAQESQEDLEEFIQYQIEGLLLAKAYLKLKG